MKLNELKEENIKFVASYSGGKDSILAISRAIDAGMSLQALLITYNKNENMSWFHNLPQNILELVEKSIGAPVRIIYTNDKNYAENFEIALKKEKENGATVCVFGDIDIEEHRQWAIQRCKKAGMRAIFPLWSENRKNLISEFIDKSYRAYITVVDTTRLDESFLGRPITSKLIDELSNTNADVCGENGEYHSFVIDGPIFKNKIAVKFEESYLKNRYKSLLMHPRKPYILNKGYVHVYTGNGKGKTTTSMGLLVRASGAKMQCYFGQFMKSGSYSEIKTLSKYFDNVDIEQYGTGKELTNYDKNQDMLAAKQGYEKAKRALFSNKYDMVILDEINVASFLGYISEQQILELIENKPTTTELILTGRYASDRVIKAADLVTEMKETKHYYNNGVEARTGIEK